MFSTNSRLYFMTLPESPKKLEKQFCSSPFQTFSLLQEKNALQSSGDELEGPKQLPNYTCAVT